MDKRGFSTPEEIWMKGAMQPEILMILTFPSFASRPYWNTDEVYASYRDFVEGGSSYSGNSGESSAPNYGSDSLSTCAATLKMASAGDLKDVAGYPLGVGRNYTFPQLKGEYNHFIKNISDIN